VRETRRIDSPFSAAGSGVASLLALPMSALNPLNPLPNAAALAIPDFGESLRGGKLIHRGMANLAAVLGEGQYWRRWKRGRRGFDGITEFSELTEFFYGGSMPDVSAVLTHFNSAHRHPELVEGSLKSVIRTTDQ